MTIKFVDGRYFVAQVFVPGEGMDFLGALYRDEGEDWTIQYRFRYYADGDGTPDDGRDEKRWYTGRIPRSKSEEEVSGLLDQLAEELASSGFLAPGEKIHRVELRTSRAKDVVDKLLAEPYTHVCSTSPGGRA